jgi:uncharacterized protein YutE (UPF0331/DUF86 family)
LVDPERVRARLERLRPLLAMLERMRAAGRATYDEGLERQLATQHALQLAIQSCIDVGAHLVAELGLPPPSDYRGIFGELAGATVIDSGLADRLGAAAGTRNVLVHAYLEVDHDEIWKALDQLDDLRAFAAAALRAVERS